MARAKIAAPRTPDRMLAVLARIAAVLCAVVLVTGTCGCMLAALPLAISAAEGVGSVVANGALGAVVAAHEGSGKSEDPDHPGEAESDREDRCEQLHMDVPGVIELHKNAAGAPEYRELQLGGSLAKPHWTPIIGQDTDPAGWRPATHFLQMDFTPPIGVLPAAGSDYLAYRQMHSDPSAAPDVEFTPLSANFGKTEGTFRWNGSLYQYAMANRLPCFPPPG
ncbi:MAG TPA: hypothetical protein VGH29_19400 [Candidatus Binataceae bacterium]